MDQHREDGANLNCLDSASEVFPSVRHLRFATSWCFDATVLRQQAEHCGCNAPYSDGGALGAARLAADVLACDRAADVRARCVQ